MTARLITSLVLLGCAASAWVGVALGLVWLVPVATGCGVWGAVVATGGDDGEVHGDRP